MSSDSLQAMKDVIAALIAPDGCPWDREQTPASLCEYVLEEAHELVEAIRHGSRADVNEELGDVLFLLVFISLLNEKQGGYTLAICYDAWLGKFDVASLDHGYRLFGTACTIIDQENVAAFREEFYVQGAKLDFENYWEAFRIGDYPV